MKLFISCPRHTEDLLRSELDRLSITIEKQVQSGMYIPFSTKNIYLVCMYSRIANRVLLQFPSCDAANPDLLRESVRQLRWEEHLPEASDYIINCSDTNNVFRSSLFASQIVKDGINERFNDLGLSRPVINTKYPILHVNLFLFGDRAAVSIDLSGGSLHERGYRIKSVSAPIKENSAAAALYRAGWSENCDRALFDPMCGSGTFLIEAAMIASDFPAGYLRKSFGFEKWPGHNAFEYRAVLQDAEERARKSKKKDLSIIGSDINRSAVYAARDNIRTAGFQSMIRVYTGDARNMSSVSENFAAKEGLVIFNPPYGERLGNAQQLIADYTRIGSELKKYFNGWNCSVLSTSKSLIGCLGMSPYKKNKMYNGSLLIYLSHFEIEKPDFVDDKEQSGMDMFRNRLTKNQKQLKKWLHNENVSCYRLYDADMPEYSAAIDIYEGKWAHLQEYSAPSSIEPKAARKRLGHMLSVLPSFLGILPENIFYKQRKKQSGKNQYSGMSEDSFRIKISENGLRFYVDLQKYLDTVIFLDHRKTRDYIRSLAKNRVFLNLFAYTGTASVYAAKGGASKTFTVDTSKTYLDWAADNFKLNNLSGKQHQRIRKDSISFLKETKDRFDLIFIDPPTFSNSKSRDKSFSIQDDYADLINAAIKVCNPGAIILFSTNFRKFRFDTALLKAANVEEITDKTVSPDFSSSKNGHRCWEIRI